VNLEPPTAVDLARPTVWLFVGAGLEAASASIVGLKSVKVGR
jgi:hypothetical protein